MVGAPARRRPGRPRALTCPGAARRSPAPSSYATETGSSTGTLLPGESWAAAASRIAAPVDAEPVAHDLSGETLRFDVGPDRAVYLRAMTHSDLPALTRWLRAPHVQRWWHNDGDPTTDRVTATYGPRVDGSTPTRMWVVEVNGRSVGFVQDYRIRDYPGFALLTPDPDAVGLDYAIGEPEWAGRGSGCPRAVGVDAGRAPPLPRRHVLLRRARPRATRRRCGSWTRPGSPGARGSTSRSGTARPRRSSAAPSTCAASSARQHHAVRHDVPMTDDIAADLRLPAGPVDLTAIETDAAPGFDGKKSDGKAALSAMGDELADLQERLWAERTVGSERRVLLVLQGMDTSGQGRRAAPHDRPRRPAGRADHQLQGTHGRGEAPTTSSGASRRACRRPATSGSSTARTTRTC